MENPRQIRGFAILAQSNTIKQVNANTFRVRSQSNPQVEYVVTNGKELDCSCPDHTNRGVVCKHIFSVRGLLELRSKPDATSIVQLAKEILETPTSCPRCNSITVKQRGVRKNLSGTVPRFYCPSCKYWFVVDEGFAKMRHDGKIITLVLDSYFRGLSARKIQEQLWQFYGLRIHHKTVFNWIRKYIPLVEEWMNEQIHYTSKMWHADEMAVKIGGAEMHDNWIWNVLDRETRFLLASEVVGARGLRPARHVITLAKQRAAGAHPDVIVTDKLPTYPRAIRSAFAGRANREVPFHLRKPRFIDPANNNLVERMNGTIREREKILRGFKKQETAQVLVDGFRVYYNLVRTHQTLGARPSDLALGVNVATNNRWLDVIKKAHAEQSIHH